MDGFRYFRCPSLHGVFVRPKKVTVIGEREYAVAGVVQRPEAESGTTNGLLEHRQLQRLVVAFRFALRGETGWLGS